MNCLRRSFNANKTKSTYTRGDWARVVTEVASRSFIDVIVVDIVKESGSAAGVGELEVTPVSAAIARHLGIDLSPEGKAARNRRGIVCIVHGAPTSGETVTVMAHVH